MNLDDFAPKRPYVDEARRRVAERREEICGDRLCDEDVVQLIADYAAESWQEGYEEGFAEGIDQGESSAMYEQQERDEG